MRIETHKISSSYWTQVFIPDSAISFRLSNSIGDIPGNEFGRTDSFFTVRGCPDLMLSLGFIGKYFLFKAVPSQIDNLFEKTEFELELMLRD